MLRNENFFFSANVGGRVTAAIIAKFFIYFCFCGIYLWCVELFPTAIRYVEILFCYQYNIAVQRCQFNVHNPICHFHCSQLDVIAVPIEHLCMALKQFNVFYRSTALATSSSAARIGSFCASYIIWLVSC